MATSLLLEAAFLLGLTRPLPASAALSPHLTLPSGLLSHLPLLHRAQWSGQGAF